MNIATSVCGANLLRTWFIVYWQNLPEGKCFDVVMLSIRRGFLCPCILFIFYYSTLSVLVLLSLKFAVLEHLLRLINKWEGGWVIHAPRLLVGNGRSYYGP